MLVRETALSEKPGVAFIRLSILLQSQFTLFVFVAETLINGNGANDSPSGIEGL
jgi:hypothetical protein